VSDIVIKAIMSPTPVIRPSNSPGLQGPRGWEVQLEYSVDGESWHTTPTSNDYYVRFSTDEGTTWGTAWYIRGEQGEQGATGETGATGATITSVAIVGTDIVFTKSDASTVTLTGAVTTLKGDAGADGTDGNTILSGAVDPTTEGEDGDFYLNTTSWDVFKKISGEWSLQGNIKGASGEGSGDVIGPEGATAGNLATFSGTSGKIIQDSGSKVADFEPAIGAKGTAFNKNFGSSAGDVCEGNDSRLSDARTPTKHGNVKHSATYITSSDVTYENLSANGDVGTGSSQVAQGDHNHSGTYLESVVDDTTPQLGGNLDVNGKTFTQTASATYEFGTDNKQVDFNSNNAHFTLVNNTTGTTIDWRKGNKQTVAPTTNPTYTFTAPGGACSLQLKITQHSSAVTITWPAAVKWCGSTPDFATNSAVYIVSMFYDGTNYWATAVEEV